MIGRFLQKHHKGAASVLLSVFFSQWWLSLFALDMSPLSISPTPAKGTGQPLFYIQNPLSGDKKLAVFPETHQVGEAGRGTKNPDAFNTQSHAGPGPGQPEMESFRNLSVDNMVDLFSGDFSYAIPLLDVGGYPLNIHYRSGITMDQEAGWVGLGWNINPGAISRNMRGLPDDFNGEDEVIKVNSMRPNWTAGGNVGLGIELFGKELSNLDLGLNGSLYYNNYKGLGLSAGASLSLSASEGAKGSLTAGLGLQTNSQSGISISPSFDITFKNKLADASGILTSGFSVNSSFSTRAGLQALTISSKGYLKNRSAILNNRYAQGGAISGDLVQISFAHQAYTPSSNIAFSSYQYSFNLKPGAEFFGTHPNISFGGFYSRQYIAEGDQTQSFPAYGYLYFQKSRNVPNALLDYNREKELTYHVDPPTPHIAVPFYTYDVYSISAEGSGGMFRPYRGDIGFVNDAEIRTRSSDGSLSLDLGTGNLAHAGFDVRLNSANTINSVWKANNLMALQIPFKESDSSFEAVYFKNPAEKSISLQNYFEKIGDTDPVMAVMNDFDDPVLTPFLQRYKNLLPAGNKIKIDSSKTLKLNRDKRSQTISYLTAGEASLFGLEKNIRSFPVNTFFAGKCEEELCTSPWQINCSHKIIPINRITPLRKKHHLSEITVLNADGKRYVYGLPVYNTVQKEVSFSVDPQTADLATGQARYSAGEDNSVHNNKGKDNFYSAEQLPGYAHSFLLTGIVSADYVDKTGDGITDDDMGDAVKFNYTRIYGDDIPFRWRTPFAENKAIYHEGLKTDNSDDKASYLYGEKEIWYLHSLESKTMIAAFILNDPEKGETRKDAFGAKGENGGRDEQQVLRYLKQIDLYSKADLIKNETNARPVKTVHFEYTYELCDGNPSSVSDGGKLTLKRIWFTYNKNDKGRKNPYVFLYHPVNIKNKVYAPDPAYNPSFDPKGFDRWGAYKNAADNPAGLSNSDYPYTLQTGEKDWDSAKASVNAAAWTLSDIIVPAGGRMNIQYEADDYAYVQHKRAMQMCTLVGMGDANQLSGIRQELYDSRGGVNNDFLYAFIKVPSPIESEEESNQKKEILTKYLEGVEKLYFKMRVTMPSDIYGGGEEQITTYAGYEDYGVTADKNIIWIKLKGTDLIKAGNGNASPLAKTAIQTLRLNLPSKAYPNSDMNGEFDALAVVKASVALLENLKELFQQFPVQARRNGWAKHFNPEKSFIRLNNPFYKKYGDGLRVKRITIYDNWAAMTHNTEQEATYGKEYTYTTIREINGKTSEISSGVAGYEPMVGNEENPFRQPIEYEEQIAPLAPVNNMYSEHPLGEAFFPSASVGYSKVRVRTIHFKDIKSATGWEESEFYTTKDFPTIVEHTPLEKRKYSSESLLNILNLYSKKSIAFSQGFKVELNDMNGKPKGNASYAENDPYNPIAYTKYYYKVDDAGRDFQHLNNTVVVIDSANGHIHSQAQIGKDIEIMTDMRQQEFISRGASMEFNVDGFMIGIIPVTIPMPWTLPHYELNRYRCAAVTKVVQRYGILDKIMVYEKGSLVTTENILYDGETGDVLLTRTQNEFNDPVYQFQYPAHWAYSGMGAAYANIGAVFNGVSIKDGKIIHSGGYNNIERYFESGDEIMVSGGVEKKGEVNGVNPCTGFGVCDVPANAPTTTKKIWAVHADKLLHNTRLNGIYFLDENGRFFTGEMNSLKILRSGKRNMPAVSVGSITSLENPLQKSGNQWKLVLDNSTKVVQTAATSYTDIWQVEDAKYKPLNMTEKKNALKKLVLTPVPGSAFSISNDYRLKIKGKRNVDRYRAFTNSPYFERSQNEPKKTFDTRAAHDLESWLKFDFSSLPPDANVIKAELALYQHLGTHVESRDNDYDEKRNHIATKPHVYGENNGNGSRIYLDYNTSLASLDPTILTDESALTKNIFSNNNLSNVYVFIPATHKQNSFLIDAKNLVQLVKGREGNDNTWLRLKRDKGGNGHNRECFWATDAYGTNLWDCTEYMPPLQNNGDDIGSGFADIQLNIDPPCSSCSEVSIGFGKEKCSTAPRLTIEYLSCESGYTLIQECDSFYCVRTSAIDTCLSQISDTATNPYRWGILGNWRMEKAYIYSEERTEKNIPGDHQTNIREYGTVKTFKPFWVFNNTHIIPGRDTVRWIWNSQSTQFNRKGFELENKDPLGRYNAAQYGYNESLPVAVTENARYKEQAFDGFEDYSYDNDKCNTGACKIQNHIDTKSLKENVTDEEAHSGNYSLGIPTGSSVAMTTFLEDTIRNAPLPNLYFNIDTSFRSTINKVVNGDGLMASVYKRPGYKYYEDNYGLERYNYSGFQVPVAVGVYYNLNINYDIRKDAQRMKLGLNPLDNLYKIVWEGYLTLRKNPNGITDEEGAYKFSVTAKNSFKLWIDDRLVLNAFPNDPVYYNNVSNPDLYSRPVELQHGKVYKIRVEHTNGDKDNGLASLSWIKPLTTTPIVIPIQNFHSSLSDAGEAIKKNNTKCINPEGIRVSPNMVYDEFAPVAGSRYLVSAWVKEQNDCTCQSYEQAGIVVSFIGPYQNQVGPSVTLKPSGNIIEGWQRIEETITIPEGTVAMKTTFYAAAGDDHTGKVFFDDWRFMPYHANMKSYVYDQVSLRLMAELDENNYASFYEYDDDGALIRIKKETERGIKTIRETRSVLRKGLDEE